MMIWRLTPADSAAWRAIRLEALAKAPDAFGSRLADWQDRPLDSFAARLAATPTYAVGDDPQLPLAVAGLDPDPDHPRRLWIISVYARPAARGRGYAEALLRHLLEIARADGMTELALHVGTGNEPAQRLYHRLGFAFSGAPAQMNPNGVPEAEMLLAL
ncbi:GNAT family N-acetyltransferase [Paracoccus suum]|nr:GNAT family N-acetyltransferase [Paracoccus suum]